MKFTVMKNITEFEAQTKVDLKFGGGGDVVNTMHVPIYSSRKLSRNFPFPSSFTSALIVMKSDLAVILCEVNLHSEQPTINGFNYLRT